MPLPPEANDWVLVPVILPPTPATYVTVTPAFALPVEVPEPFSYFVCDVLTVTTALSLGLNPVTVITRLRPLDETAELTCPLLTVTFQSYAES